MALWEARRFDELLRRVEWQHMETRSNSRHRGRGSGQRRARHLVKHGAYRKAVTTLTSSVAHFTSQDMARHAAMLLPSSEDTSAPAGTTATPQGLAQQSVAPQGLASQVLSPPGRASQGLAPQGLE
eukprot:6413184-Karenia_brevis.AAC.1